MMTDNELDNLFKNTLGNHEAPIPADMWQRIQPRGAKKRPVVLWWKWYTAAALVILASVATWWYADTSHKDSSTTVAAYSNSSKTEKDKQVAERSSDERNTTNSDIQQNNSSALSTTNDQTSTNRKTAPNSQSTVSSDIDTQKGHNHNTKEEAYTTPDEQHDVFANKDKASDNKTLADNTPNNDNANTIQATPPTSAAETQDKAANGDKEVAEQSSATAKNTKENAVVNKNTKKDDKKAKRPWTVEFLVSSSYADRETYDVVTETNPVFAAPIPLPQPKPSLWNYDAGVRLGIPIAKNLTLKTGLQYSQTRQNAAYQQQNTVDMMSISGSDTTFYRQLIYQTENHKSTYNAVSIPILVSYQRGKKIQVGATAGVIVNAYSWYSGQVPNGNYTATLNAKDTYKRNTGATVYAGISIAKKVGAVDIFAEPHLQYNLSSITKPTTPFKQKINTYGVSIGIRTALHR